MTRERRAEMRHYRELAVAAEKRLRERRLISSRPSTSTSIPNPLTAANFLTSTPIAKGGEEEWEAGSSSSSGPASGDTFIIQGRGGSLLQEDQEVETPPDSEGE